MSHQKTINLSHHIAARKSASINKVCKPLFTNTKITYFCYLRRYQDGSFTFLPSIIDIGSYLFEDGVYPYSWFAGLAFDEIKSGYLFWDLAKQVSVEKTHQISKELAQSFKLTAGIEILQKTKNYCEFYSFSGNSPEIYFIPLPYLHQFIYYFRQVCHPLIVEACENRLQIDNQANVVATNPIVEINYNNKVAQLNNEFNIRRYYLRGLHDGVFLTKREVNILKQLDKGSLVKNIAGVLCISPRTLEHHIANIKNKLCISRTTELLHIARVHNLLP